MCHPDVGGGTEQLLRHVTNLWPAYSDKQNSERGATSSWMAALNSEPTSHPTVGLEFSPERPLALVAATGPKPIIRPVTQPSSRVSAPGWRDRRTNPSFRRQPGAERSPPETFEVRPDTPHVNHLPTIRNNSIVDNSIRSSQGGVPGRNPLALERPLRLGNSCVPSGNIAS